MQYINIMRRIIVKKSLKKVLLMVVAAFALVLAGCQTSTPTDTEAGVVGEMAGQELEDIQQDNDEKEKVLVIDVRSKEEYDEGHVKHAINIPLDELEANLDRLEDYKDEPVITVCNTGNKSEEAAQILIDNEFTDVTNVEGVKDFEGYDLVQFESILIDETEEAIADYNAGEEIIFVDAREQEDFETSAFPGAISADSENADAVLAELPEDKDVRIVNYCYSGNRSAVVADAIADAGYTNVQNALYGTKEYEDYELEEK